MLGDTCCSQTEALLVALGGKNKGPPVLHKRMNDTRFELKELGFVAEHSGVEMSEYNGLQKQHVHAVDRIFSELKGLKESIAEEGGVVAFTTGLVAQKKAM